MTRRTVPRTPKSLRASNDRWLFGYADVVTLLFACFASLYAAELAPIPVVAAPAAELAPTPASPEAPLERTLNALVTQAGSSTSMDLAVGPRGLVLSLAEAGSFPAGSAELSAVAREVMLTVADALRDVPNLVRVEGHTDDTPINTIDFASNWELSTARATEVVRLLVEEGGLDPARLSAAGYAEHRPRVPNDTLTSRARNRRVDVVVLDAEAAREEPQ